MSIAVYPCRKEVVRLRFWRLQLGLVMRMQRGAGLVIEKGAT